LPNISRSSAICFIQF
jgi:hypothetical protein